MTARTVVSQSQVPPIVLGSHIHVSRSSHGPSQGVPHIPNYGYSYGQSYGPQYGQNYQPYGYGYQQPTYSSNYGFVAPPSQGTPYHNASMQPYTCQTGGGYYGQGHGIYSTLVENEKLMTKKMTKIRL